MIITIRGTKDLFGRRYLIYKQISELFEQRMTNYGFDRLIMPVLEQIDLYNNVGNTSDIVSKEMFIVNPRSAPSDLPYGVVNPRSAPSDLSPHTVPLSGLHPSVSPHTVPLSGLHPSVPYGVVNAGSADVDLSHEIEALDSHVLENKDNKSEEESRIVLRPEGTMSCVRHLINTGQINKNDVRLFYNEKMFRYNRPQKGREREFIHLGCEVFKSDSVHTEAEIISCLYFFMKSLNIDDFKLCINTTGSRASLANYVSVLQNFFEQKSDLLSEANKIRLNNKNILRLLDQLNEEEKKALSEGFPSLLDHITQEERERFSLLCSILKNLGVEFVVDQFIIRGLDYYEGCIFELVAPEYSIAGGGRYRIDKDKLKLEEDIIGFGWAIGYERMSEYVSLEPKKEPLYLIFALGNPSFALEVASLLRIKLNKKTKLAFGSMKKCISRATALDPDYVVFCGENEEQQRVLNLKNWRSGEKSILSLDEAKI